MVLGDYPADYNPKVHGPYDPARFYGKRKCTPGIGSESDYVMNLFPDGFPQLILPSAR